MTELKNNLEEVWIQKGSFGYVVVKNKDSNPEWVNRPIQVCSVSILHTIQEELQKTRARLEKAESILKVSVDINISGWQTYRMANQYFKDKDKQGE